MTIEEMRPALDGHARDPACRPRRSLLAGTALCVTVWLAAAGCVDSPSPGPDPDVAHFGEHSLPASTLAHWLVLGQPLPLETGVAEELARHWLELVALREHLRGADSLAADALRAAIADAIRDSAIAADRAERFPDLPARVAAETDRLVRSNTERLIAHVLRRADSGTRTAERELQRLSAERIRARLLAGGSWAEANAENEDEEAGARGGVIGLIAPGDLPAPLDSAAASLQPGGFSEVIQSGFGFHVLYRPRIEREWRARLADIAADLLIARADSIVTDELMRGAEIELAPGVAATLRALAREPWRSAARADTLARSANRAWTAGAAARGLAHLPVGARRALIASPDDGIRSFLFDLIARDLIADAAAGRAAPDAATIGAIERTVRDRIRSVITNLERNSGAESAPAAAVRAELRTGAVEWYLEAIVARRASLEPLPATLVLHLLDDAAWVLNTDLLDRAVERARHLIEAANAGAVAGAAS